MRRASAIVFLIALLAPGLAYGQGAVLQGGPWTPGHAPMYVGQGNAQAVIQDSGPAGGGAIGLGLSEWLLTKRGNGTSSAPYAGTGTGAYGATACSYDAPTTNATGYHYLCFDPNAQGGGLIAYGSGGIASQLPLNFIINGATYQFPFSTTGVVGPNSSTAGHFAVWNNTAGTLLADSVTMPAGAIANGSLGLTGSAPTLSSCGTSPSILGTDLAGTVTMGTGTPTGCVITFAAAKGAAPHCAVTWRATPLASQSYTISTTAITLTQTATSSNVVDYVCAGL